MSLSENMWLQVCEELVKLSVISDDKTYKHHITVVPSGSEDVVLQIETEEDRYELHLFVNIHSIHNNVANEYLTIFIDNDNIEINIKSILVDGYTCVSYENVNDLNVDNVTLLKSILKSLASNHSKSIQQNSFRNVNGKDEYPSTLGDIQETLNNLYEIIEKKTQVEVDGVLFRKGVEKLNFSNYKMLMQLGNTYVQSSGLKSNLFFKVIDENNIKCKIIKTANCKCVPLVYDFLVFLIFISTPKIRQHHFHKFLEYYYNELERNLHKSGYNIMEILPYEIFQKQIKDFLPYVKVEVALVKYWRYLKSSETSEKASENHNTNVFDSDNIDSNVAWKTILEIYDAVLYDKLSTEDCYKIVENKLNSCDYEYIKWELTPLGYRSGYLGDYYKLNIDIIHNGARQRLHLFAKYLPTYNDTAKEMAEISFEKEEFFYRKFILEINKVGLKDITDFAPNSYFSRSNDVIVLEDMSMLNCNCLGKGEAFSYENTLLVTKQLVKLHASSLLYEEIMSEKIGKPYRIADKYAKFLEETLLRYKNGKPLDIMACGVTSNLSYLFDMFPDILKEITMQEFKEELKTLYDEMLRGDLTSKIFRNVVAQGDSWGNNFLFKRDDNEKPIACYLIDFQIIRYCPPSHELLFFLYINTDRNTRRTYMKTILHQYYQELSQIFKRYNFDLSKIYTYQEFLESCEMIKPMAVCLASVYLPMVLYPQKKIDDILVDEEKANNLFNVDRKEVLDEVHESDFYRNRMRDIVEDLYEICELNVIKKRTK